MWCHIFSPEIKSPLADYNQFVFPIVGGRKVSHLKGNIEALGVELTDAEIDEIEDVEPFDPGFPLNFLFGHSEKKPYRARMTSNDIGLITTVTPLESVPKQRVFFPPSRVNLTGKY